MNWFKKKSSLMFIRAAIVSIALIIWIMMFNHHDQVMLSHDQLNQKMDRESRRFHTLNEKTLLAEEYKARFEALVPVDKYKQENRLALLDALEQIRKKFQLANFKYEIEPRQPYKYNDGLLLTKGLKTYSSDVSLEFGILHESHLMAVLAEFRNLKTAVTVLHACSLKPVNATIGTGQKIINLSASSNINATCQLKWFTFDF